MDDSESREETLMRAIRGLQAGERATILNELSQAESALRQRIEERLAAEEGVATEGFVAPGSDTGAVTAEGSGSVVGRYKILQQIGEGGCGVVYMAEQTEPVRRRVALKVIKPGMDTKRVLARFEAERQALALMDHPNIAKVLEAGATPTGRPFFVMELVRGIPITDYCDENKLDTRQRLELFVQVCQAIQHAHQKGIIHRDVKPSNILVADNASVPLPKIIDFGIAKAITDQRLTEKTLFTAFEQFIGTPAYMSPEQAKLSGLDIDTRSDVYSLGVLLYELLTGKTPFESERLLAAGLDEIRRIIREEEAPRPSTKLSTLEAAEQTAIARCRDSLLPKLLAYIRGDLDWIVMKTLEKDRNRRYETANGLALDIKRFLHSEPVMARPPSQLYRFQKFVGRNKLAFIVGASMVALLVLGIIAIAWQAVRATKAEREQTRLRENESELRKRAEAASMEAKIALSDLHASIAGRLLGEAARGDALAYLVQSLLENPTNADTVVQLASVLTSNCWPVPARILQHNSAVRSAHFSPDGAKLVTASGNYVRIWDTRSGEALTRPLKQITNVLDAQFGDDGKSVVVRLADHTSRLLGGTTNEPLSEASSEDREAELGQTVRDAGLRTRVAKGSTAEIRSAEFSPDTRHFVTVSGPLACTWDILGGPPLIEQSSNGTNRTIPSALSHPDWLLPLAEAISGRVLDAKNRVGPTTSNRLEIINQLRLRLDAAPDDDDWVVWGRWFLSDVSTRRIAPFSKTTVTNYFEQCVRGLDPKLLGVADHLALGNPELVRRVWLAREILDGQQEGDKLADADKFADAERVLRGTLGRYKDLFGSEDPPVNFPSRFHVNFAIQQLIVVLLMEGKIADADQFTGRLHEADWTPRSTDFLLHSADLQARHGNWKGAASRLATASEIQTNLNAVASFKLALLLLQIGDLQGYRKHCDETLARFGGIDEIKDSDIGLPPNLRSSKSISSPGHFVAAAIAGASLLAPGDAVEVRAANEVVDEALTWSGWRAWAERCRHQAESSGTPGALNGAAWLLATSASPEVRDGPTAVAYAEKAVAATGRKQHMYLDTLASAYAELGNFGQAITTQKEALALLKDEATERDHVLGLSPVDFGHGTGETDYLSRLKLYNAGTPYHGTKETPFSEVVPLLQLIKGLAEYRQGDFSNAVERLVRVRVSLASDDLDIEPVVRSWGLVVLAMAQHQLGQADKARVTLASGIRLVDSADPGYYWTPILISKILLREAKMLIGDESDNVRSFR